jgi:signal transduction histidine kinase/ActR/RegA family two-component response regulator
MEHHLPHGLSTMWDARLALLQALSDGLIALACFTIPLALLAYVRRRKDLRFGSLFWLFSLFIFSSGITHVLSIFTIWTPAYWLEGWLKAATALLSVATAIVLWRTIPQALEIPSPAALENAKHDLETSNAELRAANERTLELAERSRLSERAKDEFLATMGHELRTPISAILGFADLLGKGPLAESERDYVQTIQQSGSSLLRVIDDLLDLSSLEGGKLPLKAAPMSPADVAGEVVKLLRETAQTQNVRITAKLAANLPPAVAADRARILQILLNVAGNAIKHCGRGDVTLSVSRLEPASQPGRTAIEYRISDTGPGLSAEEVADIFEPFTELDQSHGRLQPTVGLGLPISQRLAALMGGSLTCESTPGEGSTFTFRCEFPLEDSPRAESPTAPDLSPDTPLPLRLLIAEDDATNRKLIILVLKGMGYATTVAMNGFEALARYAEAWHDCILMDMQMPEMDGIAATQTIRELESAHPGRLPAYIIAFTANVLPNDRQRCLAAGMNEILTKPLKPAALREALARAAIARRRPADAP